MKTPAQKWLTNLVEKDKIINDNADLVHDIEVRAARRRSKIRASMRSERVADGIADRLEKAKQLQALSPAERALLTPVKPAKAKAKAKGKAKDVPTSDVTVQ